MGRWYSWCPKGDCRKRRRSYFWRVSTMLFSLPRRCRMDRGIKMYISPREYLKIWIDWKAKYTKNNKLRFGQYFCNRYGISDPEFFFEKDPEKAWNIGWRKYTYKHMRSNRI